MNEQELINFSQTIPNSYWEVEKVHEILKGRKTIVEDMIYVFRISNHTPQSAVSLAYLLKENIK